MNSKPINLRLKGLEELLHLAFEDVDNESLIEIAKKSTKSFFLGTIDHSALLWDIEKARKFSNPSALYGHRYGRNIAGVWNIRPNHGGDLYCTDSESLLKNKLDDASAKERIAVAEDGVPVIAFFGGSTMMSMGARTPEFSIPSLVEQIFNLKYKKKVICINYGLGGTSSRDAFNVLVHDALMSTNPDLVVFYDGWNCCSYFGLENILQQRGIQFEDVSFARGEGLLHLSHNMTLSNIYNPIWCFVRAIKLWFSILFSVISKFFNNATLRKLINWLQNKIFTLRPAAHVDELVRKLCPTVDELAKAAEYSVCQYIHVHNLARLICKSKKSNFLWIQQPLVFWGNKPLTENELNWKKSGFSSGNPALFEQFKAFLDKQVADFELDISLEYSDFSNIFDDINEEVYIDSGHLNRLGNLLVSSEICTKIINKGII